MGLASLSRWLSSVVHAWKHLQVSYYGGKYSIERLFALDEYTQNTALSRVLLVCIGTPAPMAVLISVQALVPLQDPADGCSANFGFWIRSGILSFTMAVTLTTQATHHIDGVRKSTIQLFVMCALTSLLFTAGAIAISAALIFPVPFFVLTLCPVFYVALLASCRIVLGELIFRQMLQNRDQTIRYIYFVGAQNAMVFTYPAYETLFRAVRGSAYQLPVILLLPLIKVALRNLVLRCMTSLEDMMPEAVIFTVDFFNAVYIATCMQSASSATAIVAITLTDLSQTVVMLYSLHQRTSTLSSRLRQNVKNSGADNILSGLCALCRDPNEFRRHSRAHLLIRSCISHGLATTSRDLLTRLECIPRGASSELVETPGLLKLVSSPSVYTRSAKPRDCSARRTIRSIFVQKRSETIYPITRPAGEVQPRPPDKERKGSQRERPAIIRETLEALFTTECIVLTAYLEAIIPFFYCSYMLVMVQLPSSRFHTEMAGVTSDNVVETIFPVFLFGLLQIATFVVLAAVIKRNCGVHMSYQLAFVLETHMPLIQGKFMFWVLIMLCFRIVHFGVDFTFQFQKGYYS
ncbi:hypothetical protein PF004_g8675 [Phytophthora fragariae]|uniref:Uncharacterized protein n=1 Tax=Phytophthora fragariae TaxID=53985 RepID=A0A6G0P6F2_9STRA|nr:hypothetical protein PF004_g8675 [Phytophthora fragariae]